MFVLCLCATEEPALSHLPSWWAGVSPLGGDLLMSRSRSGVGVGGKANPAPTSWKFPSLPSISYCLGVRLSTPSIVTMS